MKYLLCSIPAFFMLFSCHPQRSSVTAQPQEITVAAEEAPEIMFVHLKVWKKEGVYGGAIEDKKQVAGRLRQNLRGIEVYEGQWLASFLDEKNQMIMQVAINNPLEKQYETTDEEGQLRSVEVKTDEADCFIRVQYDPRFSGLQIEQIGPSQQRTKIIFLHF